MNTRKRLSVLTAVIPMAFSVVITAFPAAPFVDDCRLVVNRMSSGEYFGTCNGSCDPGTFTCIVATYAVGGTTSHTCECIEYVENGEGGPRRPANTVCAGVLDVNGVGAGTILCAPNGCPVHCTDSALPPFGASVDACKC